jgi:hypothetical protein
MCVNNRIINKFLATRQITTSAKNEMTMKKNKQVAYFRSFKDNGKRSLNW